MRHGAHITSIFIAQTCIAVHMSNRFEFGSLEKYGIITCGCACR
jgi:hypothetical protein